MNVSPWIVTQIPLDGPSNSIDFSFKTEERALKFKEKATINGGGCFYYSNPTYKEITVPTERKYYDIDGNEVSLGTLCHQEPAWAAARLQVTQDQEEELAEALTDLLAWVYPIAGDNTDQDAADNETRTAERAKNLIDLRQARIELDKKIEAELLNNEE